MRLAWAHVVGIQSNSNIRDLELHAVGENQGVVCQLYLNVHINCVRSHPSPKSQVLIRAAAAQEAEGAEKLTPGTAVSVSVLSLPLCGRLPLAFSQPGLMMQQSVVPSFPSEVQEAKSILGAMCLPWFEGSL